MENNLKYPMIKQSKLTYSKLRIIPTITYNKITKNN